MVPNLILIDRKPPKRAPPKPSLCDAWQRAIKQHFPDPSESPFTVLEGKLREIDAAQLSCDCIVSPANSFGIMDGGFDYELSLSFKVGENFWSLTNHCQSYIRRVWNGYVPPTSCTLVPLPEEVAGAGRNPWKAHVLAILPTMRVPGDVSWHQDLVYNAMWTLLVEIQRWNSVADANGHHKVGTVLMTGLGTGQGGIAVDRCAQQMVLAVKHFKSPFLGNVRFNQPLLERAKEVQATTEL